MQVAVLSAEGIEAEILVAGFIVPLLSQQGADDFVEHSQ
jgi:hypothetical protein